MEDAKAVKLIAENMVLRKLLWLSHGCEGLYGDDGEMQCGKCLLDFKRDSIEAIRKRFNDIRIQKMVEHGKVCGASHVKARVNIDVLPTEKRNGS